MSDSASRRRLARAAAKLAVAAGARLPPLILMTDDARLADPMAAARALPKGSMVIVRARDRARLVALVQKLMPVARCRGLFMLAAGAMVPGADGVHLPEARVGEAARLRATRQMLVTVSAHSFGALRRCGFADAVLLSPVFPTDSHPGRAALGPVRANLMARQAPVPVYALGGITPENAGRLCGFCGLAGIGALQA
jgi:thiamine-phosphate pyrophosphorylase